MHVVDLTKEQGERRSDARAAKLGLDIPDLADLVWSVCTVCDCPAAIVSGGGSACCGATLRIHGWRK